jgi:hypothetical protein
MESNARKEAQMRKAWIRAGTVVAFLSIGILPPGQSFANDTAAPRTKRVTVPAVTDTAVSVASKDINDVGLVPLTRSVVDSHHQPGLVIAQDPAAGAQAALNSQVVLDVASTEIAIQPGTTVSEATGQTRVWGQLLVHRALTIDLKTQTQHVPLLAVAYQGRECVRGDDVDPLRFAEPRSSAIAERLTLAWILLDSGGTLEASTDETLPSDGVSIWHLTNPLGPQYGSPEPQFPALYVRHPILSGQLLKILTVYPEDAEAFGQPDDVRGVPTALTASELADYLVALLQAHYLLFHKRVFDPNSYDQLEICKTRDGRIFKEIALQIHQAAGPETRGIESVLDHMSVDQATRLATLAYKAPTDWRLRRRF